MSSRSRQAFRQRSQPTRRFAAPREVVKREHLQRLLLWLATLGTVGSGVLNIYSVIGHDLPERVRILEKIFPLAFQDLSRYRSGFLASRVHYPHSTTLGSWLVGTWLEWFIPP